MLVSELIASAMRLIGTLASGETPSTEESTDVFAALNQMLEAWSTEQTNLYLVRQGVQALQNGTASYALAQRPLLIRDACMVTAQGLRLPVEILNSPKWAALLERAQAAQVVRALYCDYGYPSATLYVSPVPNAGGSIEYHFWTALAAFATQQDQISFPPGYVQALRYNLAVQIAPEFGMQADPAVAAIAGQSKAALQKLNAQYLAANAAVDAPPPPMVAAQPAK